MSTDAVDRNRAILIGALATLLYLVTAPALPNLDGLGYLKLLGHNFAAGHLLYMPLLRAATRLCGGDGWSAGRLLNAILAGSGVVLTYGIVRRALRDAGKFAEARFAAGFAACGLALSYGYWIQGNDVESYALATVALLSTVRLSLTYRAAPSLGRAALVGVCLGASVLCHLEHVLLTAYIIFVIRRPRDLVVALGTGGALALGAYAYAALLVRGHDLAGALGWILTAQHGFAEGGGPYRLADAIYGLAKSIVWSPYLYEADAQKLIGQLLLGLVPLVALGTGAWLRRRDLQPLDGWLALAWGGPYAIFAVIFFGSDSERWIFVLPLLWLVAGALVAGVERRARIAAAALIWIGGLNFITGIWPAHHGDGTRQRAEAIASKLSDGDLLIFPGHGYDEYVSFLARARVYPMPFVYYAARDGADGAWLRLEREVAAAMMRGGHVYALRIFADHGDARGWSELEQLGLSRDKLRARMIEGLRPAGDGDLVLLDPIMPP